MNKKDYLETWGYLQTLKDILEQNAREAADLGDKDLGIKLAGGYMQTCAKISAMQRKINDETEAAE